MGNELNPDKARRQARREKNRRKREREKAVKASQKKWDIPLRLDYVLIFALISLIVYKVTVNTVNSYKLAAYGENQVAYVYAKKKQQARHFRYYRFDINCEFYNGYTIYYPQLKVGESIMIVYLPSDPSVNDSATNIEELRSKQHKRQERRQKFAEKFR